MYRVLLFACLVSALISCQAASDSDSLEVSTPIAPADAIPPAVEPTPREVLETYSDKSHIGRPRRNKIKIDIVKNGEWQTYHPANLAIIRFYSLGSSHKWELSQTFEFDDDALEDARPESEDFNNDGFRDVTFISGQAARGANERRTLLIYDKASDELVHIKNSSDYPNLEYDRTLKCITSWMFTGSTTTVFLRLQGDTLQEFASVDEADYITATVIDPDGKSTVISRTKNHHPDDFIRYSNFNPVDTR
jgi:hypothetical protein